MQGREYRRYGLQGRDDGRRWGLQYGHDRRGWAMPNRGHTGHSQPMQGRGRCNQFLQDGGYRGWPLQSRDHSGLTDFRFPICKNRNGDVQKLVTDEA